MSDATNLDRLHDIVVPQPIPWWPPAPGWYVVIAFVSLTGLILLGWGWLRWRTNAYRRAALEELKNANSIRAISEILRRTALAFSPRTELSALTGTAWPGWLEQISPVNMSEHVRDQLATGSYNSAVSTADLSALKQYASGWIKQHRSPGRQVASASQESA